MYKYAIKTNNMTYKMPGKKQINFCLRYRFDRYKKTSEKKHIRKSPSEFIKTLKNGI